MEWKSKEIKNRNEDENKLVYIDMNRVITRKEVGWDGTHLTSEGYAKMNNIIKDFIEVEERKRQDGNGKLKEKRENKEKENETRENEN